MTTQKSDWSAEERAALIKQMTHAKDVFYGLAARAGHHQFLEFAGLMHEYIKLCAEAHEAGHDFYSLPMQEHHAAYIGQKLECVYGPTIAHDPALTAAFLSAFLGPIASQQKPSVRGRARRANQTDDAIEHGIVLSYLRLLRAANAIAQQEDPSNGRAIHRGELFDALIKSIASGLHGGASETVSAVSNVPTMTVVCQDWEESERGWGVRPDGVSLHLTEADRVAYVAEYWERERAKNPPSAVPEVPNEYSRPCRCLPRTITVDAALYERVKNSENGIRFYDDVPT
jgi:hypothetical protein